MITPSLPGGNWNFTRSYITKLVLSDDPGAVELSGSTLTLTITVPFTYYHIFELFPNLIAWSSNCYSLERLIVDYYYVVPPSPTHNPFGAALELLPNTVGGFFFLKISVPGSLGVEQDIALPGGPGGYWLQPIPTT